jgi:hypothetical protein
VVVGVLKRAVVFDGAVPGVEARHADGSGLIVDADLAELGAS